MRRQVTLIAAAAFVLEAALFSTLAALLPHYERKLGMSTFSSGVLAGSYTAGMTAGILVAGLWTSSRFGARATALAGCGLLAAASLAFGFADSVLALDLARTAQGIGAGLLWCSLLNWLILVIPATGRATALGATFGAAVFGSASGPLLGAATQLVGTVAVFAAIAIAVLCYAIVLARTPVPPQGLEGGSPLARLRLPHDPKLRRIVSAGIVPPLLISGVITIFPLQLSHFGASEAGVAAALLAGSLSCAACCRVAGRLADSGGHLRPVAVGAIVCALALIAMAAAESVPTLAAGYVLFQGVGIAFFWIPQMSLFTERGETLGMSPVAVAMMLNLTITSAYTVGPPLLTALAQAFGKAVPFLAMAVAALLSLKALLGAHSPATSRNQGDLAGGTAG